MTVREVVHAFVAGRDEFCSRELADVLRGAGYAELADHVLHDDELVDALVNRHLDGDEDGGEDEAAVREKRRRFQADYDFALPFWEPGMTFGEAYRRAKDAARERTS